MKKNIKFFLLFSLLFWQLSLPALSAQDQQAPDFKLMDLSSKQVHLGSYNGKQPVILFFWTTWCPYCRKSLKELSQMSEEFKNDGIEVLAVNVGESASKVSKFLEPYNFAHPVLLDRDGEVSRSYGVFGVPTFVIIDDKGIVRLQENYFSKDEYKKAVLKE